MANGKNQSKSFNYKVNTSKLEAQFKKDNPMINDLIYSGVSQILGIKNGPLELQIPGNGSITMPNETMIQFLVDMNIIIPIEAEVEVLHS